MVLYMVGIGLAVLIFGKVIFTNNHEANDDEAELVETARGVFGTENGDVFGINTPASLVVKSVYVSSAGWARLKVDYTNDETKGSCETMWAKTNGEWELYEVSKHKRGPTHRGKRTQAV